MNRTRLLPVHLPEIENGEAPAPDHAGVPHHETVFDASRVLIGLRVILHRGTLGPDGSDVTLGAIRLIEDGLKRGVL